MIPMIYIGIIMSKLDMLTGANLVIYIILLSLIIFSNIIKACIKTLLELD